MCTTQPPMDSRTAPWSLHLSEDCALQLQSIEGRHGGASLMQGGCATVADLLMGIHLLIIAAVMYCSREYATRRSTTSLHLAQHRDV